MKTSKLVVEDRKSTISLSSTVLQVCMGWVGWCLDVLNEDY